MASHAYRIEKRSCYIPGTYAVVYIGDILVFSRNRADHETHVKRILQVFKENGIIISKKKIEIAKRNISFLGGEIGNGTIKL
jgi:hypothetical protein